MCCSSGESSSHAAPRVWLPEATILAHNTAPSAPDARGRRRPARALRDVLRDQERPCARCGRASPPARVTSRCCSATIRMPGRSPAPSGVSGGAPQRCLLYAVPAFQIRQLPASISSLCDVLHAKPCAAGGKGLIPYMHADFHGADRRSAAGAGSRPQPSFLRSRSLYAATFDAPSATPQAADGKAHIVGSDRQGLRRNRRAGDEL